MPTLLIVDDHAAVRQAMRAGLESYPGIVVCGEAGDGVGAIEKAARLKPDVVLLDLSMPRMNGVETAAVLKRLMPEVLIVAFSLYAEFLGRALAASVGFDAVVAKAEGLGKVIECVQGLLGPAHATAH